MSKTMYADFSDDAYNALMRGDAVDNNGLRSKKGNYYPDQPTFREKPTAKEQLQDIAVDLTAKAGAYVVLKIICPSIKRFAAEKVYPVIAQKWDEWRARRAAKKESADYSASSTYGNDQEEAAQRHNAVVVDLEKYRKGA